MGYYIELPYNHDKAAQLVELHGGELIPPPQRFDEIPEGKGLVIVVDNRVFEAAGFVYSEAEFTAFMEPSDPRPRWFVLLDLDLARELSSYEGAV